MLNADQKVYCNLLPPHDSNALQESYQNAHTFGDPSEINICARPRDQDKTSCILIVRSDSSKWHIFLLGMY